MFEGARYWALCYKPEDRESMFSIYLIPPAALDHGVYSASNRNEYQKRKIIIFLGSKVWPVHRTDNLAAICEPVV
jgi:hypothetical protein